MISKCPVSDLLVQVFAASILCVAVAGAILRSEAVEAPNPKQAMVRELAASGPHPSLGEEAKVFDRFVGAWDCDYTFHSDDGAISHSSGELLFGWVLDGKALQDIWISYPKDGQKERSIGTSLRFYSEKSRIWTVVFVNPAFEAVITMKGRGEGDRIVLTGRDDEGSSLRWSFNDIKADSFIWRGEKSRDDGKTWRLEEEHHMRRRLQ